MDNQKLSDRLSALAENGDNSLDVLIEIALFKPSRGWKFIRANNAGTKLIYTDKHGEGHTYWAQDWSTLRNREKTISALQKEDL